MMTNTTYDPRLLEQWAIDPSSTQDIGRLLETYLHQYDCAFFSKKQRSHFAAFVKGLLSPLDRKSIEPIALHLLDEKSVQPMQQFFTCAPLDEPAILDICQQLLAAQLNHEGAMLSVDDTSFIKKGIHSIGVKRQYCGRLGKRENCQVGGFLSYAGDSVTAWWTMTFISPRHGSRIPTSPCVPNAVFHRAGPSLQKIRLHRIFSTGAFQTGRFRVRGSDAMPHMAVTMHSWIAYICQMEYGICGNHTKEQIFLEPPRIISSEPDRGRGRLKKYPV